MKMLFEKSHCFTLLMCSLILFPCCSILNHNDICTKDSKEYTEQNIDSVLVIKESLAITNGNHGEYLLFHNAYVNAVMNEGVTYQMRHDGLLYSFIMAERYHDTLAALDFVRILEDSGCPIDSSTSLSVVYFLEMASKSKPDPLSFLASKKLYEIYLNGKYGIEQDSQKANYYDKLCDSIAKVMNY